jgi:hypothetical protein
MSWHWLQGLLATTVLAAPVAQASCHAALKARLPQSGTVIFGEVHGTKEIPAYFAACVREFADHGETVRVFLEFDADDTERTARYLRGEIDEAALLSSPRWSRQDGRTSLAMLDLHRALKGMDVVGFLPGRGTVGGSAGMGESFLSQRLESGYNLVLVGDAHARLAPGKAEGYEPFGQYVQARAKNVVSLQARYTGGTAWACTPYCERTPAPRNGPALPLHQISFVSKAKAYTGYFSVGSISASPPAAEK